MDAATAKFEQAVPFALLPVSAGLAALHASRTRPPLQPPACPRCGSLLATSAPRLVRSKHRSHALSVQCRACGETTLSPVDLRTASRYPPCRRSAVARVTHNPPPSIAVPSPKPSASPTPPSLQSEKTSRKKTGLQQMLQRNREKEQKRMQKDAVKPAGLADFLSNL